MNYLEQIILFLSGGGLAGIWAWWRQRKTDKQSFDQKELEKYKKENMELRMAHRMLQAKATEPPLIRWKLIDGKFSYVTPAAMMNFFEPLEIKMTQIIGKTIDEVFAAWPEIQSELSLLEAMARRKTKIMKHVQLYPVGKYYSIKVQYFEPSVGIIYECELIEEKAFLK